MGKPSDDKVIRELLIFALSAISLFVIGAVVEWKQSALLAMVLAAAVLATCSITHGARRSGSIWVTIAFVMSNATSMHFGREWSGHLLRNSPAMVLLVVFALLVISLFGLYERKGKRF